MDHALPINPSWPRKKVVNSDMIAEVAYFPQKQILYVHFKTNDSVYEVSPVDRKTYDALADAPSIGGYYAKHIRSNKKYNTKKV